MYEVIVVGGGAAGMMAAACAAARGCRVLLLERNEKLGKKLYITGKGRCNLTNACETEAFFSQVTRNARFLYSAIYSFDSPRVMEFFEGQGIPLKIERGNRVFPVSDLASDIIKGLDRALQAGHVEVRLHTRVERIEKCGDGSFRLYDKHGDSYAGSRLILATGGLSYPSTGATGDGYAFAREFGHSITDLRPGLVALTTKEAYIPRLQGLSLKNVQVRIFDGRKKLFEEFGEMLFTHFGVSGPLILSASSLLDDRLLEKGLSLEIDLKPALTKEQLDARLLHDFAERQNKQLGNSLNRLLPAKLIPVVIELSGLDPRKKINTVTKEERGRLLRTLKQFPATITGTRDFKEAIITKGGVSVREVSPSTMESKRVEGLYFAGELLDVDALTGGYNLQIAWSTGSLAGNRAGESVLALKKP